MGVPLTDSPAEEIRKLLDQLHGQVETRERVPHYKQVRRDKTGRTTLTLDWRDHTTREPGLLAQLSVVASTIRDGVIIPGYGVPGGSPGWDADGALTPIVSGGKPESSEPIADEWHVGYEIHTELAQIGRDLYERGYRPPATLITIALDKPDVGEWIAARLRSLVQRARIAADYDAPIVTLRDIHCPECGGEMRVRTDASSDVWCAGRWTVEGPAEPGERYPVMQVCGARWPRYDWVNILAEQEQAAS